MTLKYRFTPQEQRMTDVWRIFVAAARADSRALRLLPLGVKVAPTDLHAAVADAEHEVMRQRENKRVRAWREKVA